MLKGYRLKVKCLKQPHSQTNLSGFWGFGVFTFYHDPNVGGQWFRV